MGTYTDADRFRAQPTRELSPEAAATGVNLAEVGFELASALWALGTRPELICLTCGNGYKPMGLLVCPAVSRYFIRQHAESRLTQRLFGHILRRIERLAWRPTCSSAASTERGGRGAANERGVSETDGRSDRSGIREVAHGHASRR